MQDGRSKSPSHEYPAAAQTIARLGLSTELGSSTERNLARSLPRNFAPSSLAETTPTPLSRSVARASSRASPLRKAWQGKQSVGPQSAMEVDICAKLGDAITRLNASGVDNKIGLAESVPLGMTRRTTQLTPGLGREMDLLEEIRRTVDSSHAAMMPVSEAPLDLLAQLLVLVLQQAWARAAPCPKASTIGDVARGLRLCADMASRAVHRHGLLRWGAVSILFAVLEAARWPWEELGEWGTADQGRVVECSCAAVIDLSVEEDFVDVTGAGAPSVLVALLESSSPGVATSAARVLKNIAVHELMCDSLVRGGAVPALARCCDAAFPDALREQAARALGNIATHEHEHEIGVAGGVEALVAMLDLARPMSMVAAALGALCNQAESPAMREAFVLSGGVARVVPVLTGAVPSTWRSDAAQQEANGSLAAAADGWGAAESPPQQPEEEEDPLEQKLGRRVATSASPSASPSSVSPAANSPAKVDRWVETKRGAHELAQLCKQAGWILVSVATDPELSPAAVADGGMRAIVMYAAGDDDESKEEGAWAIANLSSDAANAPCIVEADGLQVLLSLLDSPRNAVRLQAVWALANLASIDHSKHHMYELSAVPRLVEWMREGAADAASMLQVTRCLANLLVLGGCREQFLACGGLHSLLHVTAAMATVAEGEERLVEDDTLSAVARALANLTYDEKMAAEAVRAGVLPPLVAMLKREDARQLQQEALMATVNITAANAADGCRHEEQLVECGVLEPLVALMTCSDEEHAVQEQATLALGNIASGESELATQQRVLELGVLDTLARLRCSPSPKLARAAAGTLEALVHSLTPASRRALNADSVAILQAERRPRRSSPLVTNAVGVAAPDNRGER